MYQNKLVCAIKVNGRILREHGGAVQIPFGSEYSVYLKNLNAVRAKFKLAIDGTDATSGTWIVIPANSSVEMERFIQDGNWDSGRRFKFIERTAEIEQHRGIKGDDGLVRVEFQVERVRPVVDVPRYEYYDVPVPRPWFPTYPWPPRRRWSDGGSWTYTNTSNAGGTGSRGMDTSSSITNQAVGNTATSTSSNFLSFSEGASASATVPDVADVGITVAGSVSHQRFTQAPWFETGPSEVLVLQLRGMIAGKTIEAPVTVQSRIICGTCGRESKSDAEFCARCGAALEGQRAVS